ncbi:hypoxia inducible factor 1 alpha [Anopheles sinensis]|uniref:Hypoxia inducible factor 1 alpha n=1 Tax=Anopheles sinensis TaxID=74873 RepID=A0A084W3K8_ANOSI|nr:hypoxia inducible factor 1 alpha [Anopheles sinensis]
MAATRHPVGRRKHSSFERNTPQQATAAPIRCSPSSTMVVSSTYPTCETNPQQAGRQHNAFVAIPSPLDGRGEAGDAGGCDEGSEIRAPIPTTAPWAKHNPPPGGREPARAIQRRRQRRFRKSGSIRERKTTTTLPSASANQPPIRFLRAMRDFQKASKAAPVVRLQVSLASLATRLFASTTDSLHQRRRPGSAGR